MTYNAGSFELIVVGAGHAGIEAALAGARLGKRTVCFTTTLDFVGNMPCNPAIGGTGKGQLVREIDALGGEMGRAADKASIQYRMLNLGKGPAVHSLRAQADRTEYTSYMKQTLESTKNLTLKQAEVTEINVKNGEVCGVTTASGAFFAAQCVILCCGTFLGGKTFVGEMSRISGPDGVFAATDLTKSLKAYWLPLRRFKTGTPPRIDGNTVDYSKMEVQRGDTSTPFSYSTEHELTNSAVCYLTYTNERTHELIRSSLHRSPLYKGDIEGTGPRYCPSIEDKVVRFSDKPRHQLFLEPCGLHTHELYLGGLSTSLPEDVQTDMLHTISGLEHAEIMRPGYAIEYDCLDPMCLAPDMSVKSISGLFAAGQLCSTSGYEEAAALGLVAGVNAVRHMEKLPPFTLKRSDGYIGTLIDDIVTKGTNEPYRMMTSRTEYRLWCRQDNADKRLMEKGFELGLVTRARVEHMRDEYGKADAEVARLRGAFYSPTAVNGLLCSIGSTPVTSGISLFELLKRPEISYAQLSCVCEHMPNISKKVAEQVEIAVKYEGYLKRQEREIEAAAKMENYVLPDDIDYTCINSLRTEARHKLNAVRPISLAQAGRISGVSPSDIGALIMYLGRKNND